MINIVPIQDMIIVMPVGDDPTLGGLIHESDNKQAGIFGRGIVFITGPGYTAKDGIVPMTIQIGDEVIFQKERAFIFTNDKNEKFYLISERDISGILDKEPIVDKTTDSIRVTAIDLDKLVKEALEPLEDK